MHELHTTYCPHGTRKRFHNIPHSFLLYHLSLTSPSLDQVSKMRSRKSSSSQRCRRVQDAKERWNMSTPQNSWRKKGISTGNNGDKLVIVLVLTCVHTKKCLSSQCSVHPVLGSMSLPRMEELKQQHNSSIDCLNMSEHYNARLC